MSNRPVKSEPRASAQRAESSRMPEDSTFYNRLVPVLLAGMGLLMVILILVAAGVLLGWINF